MSRFIAALLTLLAGGNTLGQTIPPELKPVWTLAVPPRIEWVAPAGRDAARALVVGTSRGELLILDGDTGAARFVESVRAEPGVRLADGAADDLVYGYDRFSVYALALSDGLTAEHARNALLWQVGEWPLPVRTYQGDPEFLTRLVAAHSTPFGLLLARSDGRVALLKRENGRVRWQFKLPELPDARLHVRAASAALVFKQRDKVKAAFFQLDRRPLEPAFRTLGETWPIQSALLPGARLLAVWPKQAIVTEPDGRLLKFEPKNDESFRAAALGVYVPESEDRSDRALLLASYAVRDGRARLHAHDLADGRVAWRAERDAPPDAILTSLRVQRQLVLVTSRRTLNVYEAATGRALAAYDRGQAARLLDATVAGETAYGLYRKLEVNAALEPQTSFTLVRVPLRRPPNDPRGVPAASDAASFSIELAETPRQVVWTDKTLVVVEAARLQAYALP